MAKAKTLTINNNAIEFFDTESIINLIYPIGSIYLSTTDTNPLELFGFGE